MLMTVEWTADRIAAVALGAGLLVALFVFFFGKRKVAAAAADAGASPEVTVVVEGGYSPDVIRGRVGQPLRLVFDRNV